MDLSFLRVNFDLPAYQDSLPWPLIYSFPIALGVVLLALGFLYLHGEKATFRYFLTGVLLLSTGFLLTTLMFSPPVPSSMW